MKARLLPARILSLTMIPGFSGMKEGNSEGRRLTVTSRGSLAALYSWSSRPFPPLSGAPRRAAKYPERWRMTASLTGKRPQDSLSPGLVSNHITPMTDITARPIQLENVDETTAMSYAKSQLYQGVNSCQEKL